MREELEKLASDINKVISAEKILSGLETIKAPQQLEVLIEYAIEHNIIKNTYDVLEVATKCPDVKEVLAQKYDCCINKRMESLKDQRKEAERRYEYRYAGTYEKLSDVPGYGTEWNNRCIPAGVVIGNGNERC